MNWTSILDALFPAQCALCNALGSGLCGQCVPPGTTVNVTIAGLPVVASGWYEGALRAAVLAVKDGRRDVAESLGERIAPSISSRALLVPVPTTRARVRVRGVDGVALIASTAAKIAGATVVEALEQRAGDAQRGRSRHQRLAAHDRFRCRRSLPDARVTLIDDVCTTGATLADCANVVRAAGGCVKGAVVVAATKGGPLWEPPRS